MVLFTWPELGVLAGQDRWGEQTIDCICCGAIELLWVWKDALQTNQCPTTFKGYGDLSWGPQLHWCIICLDDIVIFSKDLASHLERLEAVFWKLEEAGLKPSKCVLFQLHIAYLGHIVSAQGIAADKGKIDAIKKWPVLTSIMEAQNSRDSWDTISSLSQIHTGSLTPAWVNFRWKCQQEKGCHLVQWQVPTGL